MKINELTLYNDNSQRELSTLTRNKQELMVDDNLLKLEIKRLRDMLNLKSDDVLSLEKRKLQLETVSNWFVIIFTQVFAVIYMARYEKHPNRMILSAI